MKLIIQIPCFNEEETLTATVADLPRQIEGVDTIEYLIIDDGSSDRTQEVARNSGVHHIVAHKHNKGLARAFATGLEASLKLGADIIVNTDGDNQYRGEDIASLVAPVVAGKADIVVGDRQTHKVAHFSPLKKLLQKMGSKVVRALSGTNIPDAVSGFRAFSREAAMRITIVSSFSYTIETLIQAGMKKMTVTSVPVGVNEKTRESRLFKSMRSFIQAQLTTMIRMYAMFKPLRTFFFIGFTFSIVGVVPIIRFLYFYFTDGGDGHIQSLVLGGAFLIMGVLTLLIALLADLIGRNRQLTEEVLERVRRLEHDGR
ncbi:glycosyltransferase family 2 protein [Kordiimonas lacus]|jgi:glycosyltransferase involved in cell wall biosynthesis|uniref:glycosyltransferase family 2 protein n=1 Tax=Kordiimonas lacus TaxID=637679 RepID=UPI002FDA8B5E